MVTLNNEVAKINTVLTEEVAKIDSVIKQGINELSGYIDSTSGFIEAVKAETIAIQHINFSTASKEFVPDKPPYMLDEDGLTIGNDGKPIYVSDFKITLDGYCWEVICKDRNDVILTDIEHKLDEDDNRWKSIVKVQIAVKPENTLKPQVIAGWNDTEPIYDDLKFQATVFVRSSGASIEILDPKDL